MGNDELRLGQRVGHVGERVEQLARWWKAASEEARYALLLRIVTNSGPKEKTDPTLAELQIGIYLAEAEAGEIEKG